MVTVVTQRAPGSTANRSQHVRVEVWQRLSRPKRAAERPEIRPMRPAKRHPIGRMGMDAPENAGHLTTEFAPGRSDSEAVSENRVSTVNRADR